MQHLEIHWVPQGVKGNHTSAIREWSAAFHAAASNVGYPVGVSPSQTMSSIKDAGFINVFERIIPCYLVPQKRREDFTGHNSEESIEQYWLPNWLNLIFEYYLLPWSMKLISKGLDKSEPELGRLREAVTRESRSQSCQVKFNV